MFVYGRRSDVDTVFFVNIMRSKRKDPTLENDVSWGGFYTNAR